ncbi:helicase HerA-like domain-containing protein [uncultured Limimaricola sp.]|uniref:helicase HerA-like domain-containing protein n=1 Tax=uncultured Limimaricola sp. TaxID=2211667 RepID=UPI0030F71D8A
MYGPEQATGAGAGMDWRDDAIFLGGGGDGRALPQWLLLEYANGHGLIAGATGTGKTVTLQIMAEAFSDHGVPVFLSDVKGDLAGLSRAGDPTNRLHAPFTERATQIGYERFSYKSYPTLLWDVFSTSGHPVRTTLAEMGPLLLSRLLDLTEAQEGVINIVFRVADEEGLALLDLSDLRAMLIWLGENAREMSRRYGNVSSASIGAIQRRLLVLETQGGAQLFGEPALELSDMMRCDETGRGLISILDARQLMMAPRLYATFLLWLLSELFEELPEIGDPEKPKLVLFFDEAHLLFDDAPRALVEKIEQVARLIRSKGVGVYFVSQSPADLPADVLRQLGNRVQHALRAFTARDQKALRLAAQTYRDNPDFETEAAIREVGVGEAVTSMLEKKGVPGIVERTLIRPPASRLGPIEDAERAEMLAASPIRGKYEASVDRDSAFEALARRAEAAAQASEAGSKDASEPEARRPGRGRRYAPDGPARTTRGIGSTRREDSLGQSIGDAMTGALLKELKGTSGRRLVRGILGTLFKGR